MLLFEVLCDVVKKNVMLNYQAPAQHQIKMSFFQKAAFVSIVMMVGWQINIGLFLLRNG